MEFKIGKSKYDARLDNKECPNCGNKQSYDEKKNKKHKCSNCETPYRAKVVFTEDMSKNFFQRNKEYEKTLEDNRVKSRQVIEEADAPLVQKYVFRGLLLYSAVSLGSPSLISSSSIITKNNIVAQHHHTKKTHLSHFNRTLNQ